MHGTLLAVFSLTTIAALPAQATWIVHPSGGGSFTQIATAYAVASPGDTLLVHSGSYEGFASSQAKGAQPSWKASGVAVTTIR